MARLFCLLLFLSLFDVPSEARKTQVRSGSYTYVIPSTQSLEEARMIALKRAQDQILADAYGRVMTTTSTTHVENSSADSEVEMISLSNSLVKGEWVQTVGTPEYRTEVGPDGMIALTVHVTGKIRKLSDSKAEILVKVLRNGTEDRYEGNDFKDGDEMYLSFCAPADGYLTVYLYDGADDVFCLLPYIQQDVQTVKVEGGVRYVFFSKENPVGDIPSESVSEYTLGCSGLMEINRLYVVWSPDEYFRPVDSYVEELVPRKLDFQSFQKWLSRLRMRDDESVVRMIDLKISKRN